MHPAELETRIRWLAATQTIGFYTGQNVIEYGTELIRSTRTVGRTMQPHRADTIEEFLHIIVRSGLASEQQVNMLAHQYRNDYLKPRDVPECITSLCSFLVASEVLTTYQCWKLRNGQWKGFYLDDLVLLDFLAKDRHYSYFLARDKKDGTFVRLAITPTARARGPDVEYRIDHHFKVQDKTP